MAEFKFTAVLCGLKIEADTDVLWRASIEDGGVVSPFTDITPRGTACDVWIAVDEWSPPTQTLTLTADHFGRVYTATIEIGPP